MATINFTDGTDNLQSVINKEDSTNTDVLALQIPFITSISVGDIVNYYDKDSTLIFHGIVQTIKTSGIKEVEVYDYGAELLQRTVNEIFNNQSPEEIIESIINDYTTLTYVSTITSGITISTYVANKKKAWDVVTELSEVLLANFRVDQNKNFQLELEGNTKSSKSITTGTLGNAILDGTWKEDKSKLVNSATVDGDDRQIFEREPELYSGDGSTTEFSLSEIPLDIKVEHPVGTIKTGYVEGSSTGDYTIDRDNKKVIFDTAPGSGTDNIQVTYTVSIPISVRRKSKGSIDIYGQHDKNYKKPYIKTRNDARDLALFIINRFSQPLKSATFIITSNTEFYDFNSWLPNQVVDVTDNIFNISGSYIIREVERSNLGELKVTVGDPSDDFISWSKEAQQRIKQLEEKDDNATILSEDEFVSESITLQFDCGITTVTERTFQSDTFYLEEDTNGTRNQMKNDGTGPVMRETGYSDTDLTSSVDDTGVVSSFYMSSARTDFITQLNTLITHTATGDDDTTPTVSDTTLGNETLREVYFDKVLISTTGIGFTMFQDTADNNGEDIKETGLFDASSGGNLYSHSLTNAISKDSAKEVFIETQINVLLENTSL